jgi:hypothetical protein
MPRKLILAAILVVALIGVSIYFYSGGRTPSGQAPLQALMPQNLSDIKNSFNSASGDVRILLLLSPT